MSPLKFTSHSEIYIPNYACSKTRRRLATFVAFADMHGLDKQDSFPLHNTLIKNICGPRSSKLANHIVSTYLERIGNYVVSKHPFSYKLNLTNFIQLKSKIGQIEKLEASEFLNLMLHFNEDSISYTKDEIANRNFVLKETSCGRYFHWLNNLKRDYKKVYFPQIGLKYDYDIVAAAPTLIVQLAMNCGLTEEDAAPILNYIKNRTVLRNRISQETGLEKQTVKKLLTAFFYGAPVSINERSVLFKTCNTSSQMLYFKTNTFIQDLKDAISKMWRVIRKKTGQKLRTGADKSKIYFKIEREITDIMIAHCTLRGIFHLPEHDGIRTEQEINTSKLEAEIKIKTGYSVKLEGGETEEELELTEDELDNIVEEDLTN